jgi:hypothetical protein
MALYRLATDVMSALSKMWLGARRMELQAISQTSTILPILESAHKGLTPFLGRAQETSGARDALKKQYEIDEQHDDFYRAGFYFFNARASLASALGDEVEAQSYIALRDLLYPDALFGVNRSYSEEEGAAETLSGRLTPEIKTKLSAMFLKENLSMLSVIEKQIERASELGALEKQKMASQEKEPQGPSLGDERRARYDWIEAVRMLERTLRLAVRQKATTEAVINHLLADVRKEEADADRKYLSGNKEA